MADFLIPAMEDAVTRYAQALRSRWRAVLAELAKEEVKKSASSAVSIESMLALDDVLDALADSAQEVNRDFLSLAVAGGVAVASLPWSEGWRPPNAAALEAKRSEPRFADRAAMKFAESYAFSAVKTKDAEVLGVFRLFLLDALRQGKNPKEAAKQTSAYLKETPAEWMRIARTEQARASNLGLLEEAERLGVEAVYIPDNPTACSDCKRLLIGRLFPLGSLDTASNVGRKRETWVAALPLHPNCTCLPIPASPSLLEGIELPLSAEGTPVSVAAPSLRGNL